MIGINNNKSISGSYVVPEKPKEADTQQIEDVMVIDNELVEESHTDDATHQHDQKDCSCKKGAGQNDDMVKPDVPYLPEPVWAEQQIDRWTRRFISLANRSRNFLYKVRSYRHARRLGMVSPMVFHLRMAHCDRCPNKQKKMLNQRKLIGRVDGKLKLFPVVDVGEHDTCVADDCKCGGRIRSGLENKIRLAGWRCPLFKFGEHNNVTYITIDTEVK